MLGLRPSITEEQAENDAEKQRPSLWKHQITQHACHEDKPQAELAVKKQLAKTKRNLDNV